MEAEGTSQDIKIKREVREVVPSVNPLEGERKICRIPQVQLKLNIPELLESHIYTKPLL